MRQRVLIAMALACSPGAADRRRADHGARRLGAGADSCAARRVAGPAWHGRAADHPQSGRRRAELHPCRGDVRRHHRRARPGARRAAPAPRIPTRAPCSRRSPRATSAASSQGLPAVPNLIHPPPGCRFAPRCARGPTPCAMRRRHAWTPPGRPLAGTMRSPVHPRIEAAPMLELEQVSKDFPRQPAWLLARGAGAGAEGCVADRRQGRELRAGRRIRLGQDHADPLHPAARRADRRPHPVRGRRPRPAESGRVAPVARAHPDRVPGPLHVAQPAHDRFTTSSPSRW